MVKTKTQFNVMLTFPDAEGDRLLGEEEVAKFVLGLEQHLNRHLYSMGKCDPMETVFLRWHAVEPEGGDDGAEEHF